MNRPAFREINGNMCLIAIGATAQHFDKARVISGMEVEHLSEVPSCHPDQELEIRKVGSNKVSLELKLGGTLLNWPEQAHFSLCLKTCPFRQPIVCWALCVSSPTPRVMGYNSRTRTESIDQLSMRTVRNYGEQDGA